MRGHFFNLGKTKPPYYNLLISRKHVFDPLLIKPDVVFGPGQVTFLISTKDNVILPLTKCKVRCKGGKEQNSDKSHDFCSVIISNAAVSLSSFVCLNGPEGQRGGLQGQLRRL